jgi:hypothetical protein
MLPIWSQASGAWPISRSPSAPIPRRIPRRCRPTRISIISSASSTPAPRARSASTSSTSGPFLRFRDRCAKAGIKAPITPGILPVTNFQQVVKFSRMCGASVPSWLAALFEGLDEDQETRRLVAATVAAEQVRRLQEHGVEEFHFYTLNRADLTYALCHILGLRPNALAKVA